MRPFDPRQCRIDAILGRMPDDRPTGRKAWIFAILQARLDAI
jgi:hypothetical protein